jgi:very-short-patch-repair endonuclease
MSSIANAIYDILKEAFPLNIIQKEHYVYYKGTRLFFDFLIKDLSVLIEVQGRQHTAFVKHFHRDKNDFLKQKNRDNFKIQYIQENDKYCLVRFNYDEKLTKRRVIEKISKAVEEGFYE